MRFKIDWATLIVGSKFTVFALFYFVFEVKFPSLSPRGGLYLEERFNGGFFALRVWGLIIGGAYTWRGLFSEFYVMNLTELGNIFFCKQGRVISANVGDLLREVLMFIVCYF